MPVFRGSGTKFARGDAASPEVFTDVGDVMSVAGPSIAKGEIEITNLDDVAKAYLSALDDAGEVVVEMNWNPQDAQQVLLRSDSEGNTKRNYRITWSDTSSTMATFNGEVMEFSITTEANDAVKATARVKLSAAITWS